MDNKIVDQLDKERSQAELQALNNEMDPHFIFNSLNTLNHLILNNPKQAHLFNNKLAQVYKYFLINKTRELISLKDEMEFIEILSPESRIDIVGDEQGTCEKTRQRRKDDTSGTGQGEASSRSIIRHTSIHPESLEAE